MITVKDLAKKLTDYARTNPDTEILLEYDGGVAFPFSHGEDNTAMGFDSMTEHKFLVLRCDQRGKRLVLKGSM